MNKGDKKVRVKFAEAYGLQGDERDSVQKL